jgi:hypothetical protein
VDEETQLAEEEEAAGKTLVGSFCIYHPRFVVFVHVVNLKKRQRKTGSTFHVEKFSQLLFFQENSHFCLFITNPKCLKKIFSCQA